MASQLNGMLVSSALMLAEACPSRPKLSFLGGRGVSNHTHLAAKVCLALVAVRAFASVPWSRLTSVQVCLQGQAAVSLTATVTPYVVFLITCCMWVVYKRKRSPRACFVLDFCCSTGINCYEASADNFGRFLRSWKSVTVENLKFQFKVFAKSGVGMESYAPARLFERGENVNMQDARMESEQLILDSARKVMQKTGVGAKEIDIVVLNSSLFNPVPSLTAVVVHNLKMRSNVKTFNISGMGCSAGLIALDLAARLLRVHRNCNALVLSTENITSNMYFGNDRSMMVSNCLFRCGCSAVLLTNKAATAQIRPKLQLLRLLRTSLAHDQKAFDCVRHMEDDDGKLGVSLKVNLVHVAGIALRTNITSLARSILPWSELLKVAASIARKKLGKQPGRIYMPNFKKAIDHFCIHPGGRAVIDEIGKGLNLSDYDVEPARMALERFGNTSSSGIWFALAYCEAKGRLKRGNKVWQIALGSGFKCNSAVWRVLRDVDADEITETNPWSSCIKQYPITATALDMRTVSFEQFYVKLFPVEDAN